MNLIALAFVALAPFSQQTLSGHAQESSQESQLVGLQVTAEMAGAAGGCGLANTATASALAMPSKDWIAKSGDSICGLKDAAQVSNPVLIDWQACLDATPEMKKAKSEKIDLSSPEGIKLVNEATNRVTQACEAIRTANGYCSVWKTIKHKDGRAITDISDLVKAQY